jgi:BASS family bile acid:Na+ symporter
MQILANLIVLIFVLSSVISVGMQLTVTQILSPLRNVRLVIASLIANFVVVPLIAVAINKLFQLNEPQSIGLILLGTAAGAPFLPKIVAAAKEDQALSVSVMVLLMVGSLVYVPLVLPRLLPGVAVDPLKIARSLLVMMVIPLASGLYLKSRYDQSLGRLLRLLNATSTLSLILVIILIPVANHKDLAQIVSVRSLMASALFLVLAFVTGCGFVWSGTRRQVLGFAAAARNIPSALLVGAQNFSADVPSMVIFVALVSLVVLGLLVFGIRIRNERQLTGPLERAALSDWRDLRKFDNLGRLTERSRPWADR